MPSANGPQYFMQFALMFHNPQLLYHLRCFSSVSHCIDEAALTTSNLTQPYYNTQCTPEEQSFSRFTSLTGCNNTSALSLEAGTKFLQQSNRSLHQSILSATLGSKNARSFGRCRATSSLTVSTCWSESSRCSNGDPMWTTMWTNPLRQESNHYTYLKSHQTPYFTFLQSPTSY